MSSLEPTSLVPADIDQQETQEWLDALEAVLDREGAERAHYLIESLIDKARRSGAHIPYSPNTAYVNTIPPGLEPTYPGNPVLEEMILGLRTRTSMFRFGRLPSRRRDVMREHLAILDALAAGNAQAAREAMEQHIDQVRATIIARLSDSHRRR